MEDGLKHKDGRQSAHGEFTATQAGYYLFKCINELDGEYFERKLYMQEKERFYLKNLVSYFRYA